MRRYVVYRWMAFAASLLPVAGCASIPLSTMLKMRSFDAQNFAKLDPQELRVRLIMPPEVILDIENTRLGLDTATAAGKTLPSEFRLKLERHDRVTEKAFLFGGDSRKERYVLQLAENSYGKFRELQGLVKAGGAKSYHFSVNTSFTGVPADVTKIRFTVDLQLEKSKGFFTLLDDAEVHLDGSKPDSST